MTSCRPAPTSRLPLLLLALVAAAPLAAGQTGLWNDPFRQLEELLPTPSTWRTASGAPGNHYWQQRADHVIDVELDEEHQRITGSETITYFNHSPDHLSYLWLQLDQNRFARGSDSGAVQTAPDFDRLSYKQLASLLAAESFDGGARITRVADASGNPLPHVIVGTMMRVDLPTSLPPGGQVSFSVDWHHAINEHRLLRGRGGYEHFEEDGNNLYEIAQWFPRMAAYTDVNGWQHKQFLGSGEFTLEFGDYRVAITAPADHVVCATGVLQNPEEVLTSEQRDRLEQARTASDPVFVVTPDEALANESSHVPGTRTWVFAAENVRDFAFASSRKFIWDALGVPVDGQTVLAMSYYPKEGEPLWSRYSTHAVAHTLEVYSKFTVPYPYPVAISVNGPVGGMEYPMICFNGPRPEDDGTYSQRTKYGLIGVIIHEVGHNWFPMIINSDERQWTWMDEGLNTFVQYLAEQEWEDSYPSNRGRPSNIVGYMTSDRQVPIMTNSESLLQFGSNAYAKPATALNILRETILGRELFDTAFAEYSRRWAFRRPQPADLFRTLEDASGIDLDWFWRGWFYTTKHVDIGIVDLHHHQLERLDPELDKGLQRAERDTKAVTLSAARNEALPKRTHAWPDLLDFYNEYDALDVSEQDRSKAAKQRDALDEHELALLDTDRHFYAVELANLGGLVMPVPMLVTYEDGSQEELRLPAEIWRKDAKSVFKLLLTHQPIAAIELDPHDEIADADSENNHWPRRAVESRFKLFKKKRERNPMQKALEPREAAGGEPGADH